MKTTTLALGAAGALALAVLAIQQAPLGAAEPGDMHAHMGGMMAQMQPMQGQGQMQQMPGMGMGQGQQMPGMGQMQQPSGDEGPSSLAFRGANEKMHRALAITYTGNADADFVRGMIPHHQGAIDMARIVLAFGSDPEIKALAEGIVKAQQAEIAEMEAWLKKTGK